MTDNTATPNRTSVPSREDVSQHLRRYAKIRPVVWLQENENLLRDLLAEVERLHDEGILCTQTYLAGIVNERDSLRAEVERLTKENRILELKNRGTLANNLCPNCRDKQVGQPCLACTIDSLRATVAAQAAELDKAQTVRNALHAMVRTIDGFSGEDDRSIILDQARAALAQSASQMDAKVTIPQGEQIGNIRTLLMEAYKQLGEL